MSWPVCFKSNMQVAKRLTYCQLNAACRAAINKVHAEQSTKDYEKDYLKHHLKFNHSSKRDTAKSTGHKHVGTD